MDPGVGTRRARSATPYPGKRNLICRFRDILRDFESLGDDMGLAKDQDFQVEWRVKHITIGARYQL